jgi:hypothetical protein
MDWTEANRRYFIRGAAALPAAHLLFPFDAIAKEANMSTGPAVPMEW